MREKQSDDNISVRGVVEVEARSERIGNEMRDEVEMKYCQIFKQLVLCRGTELMYVR